KREAVAILERALGPDHMDLATLLSTSANIHAMLGQHEQARALYQRAMAIITNALGPEHRRTRAIGRRQANFFYNQGQPDRAEAALADDDSDEATLARARWAIVIGELERAKQLLALLGDPLEHARDGVWSDDPWLRGELLLAHAEVALAERSFARARALAEGLRALGEPLAFFELAALVIEAELELASGSLTEATEHALARELEQPGVPPARRARVLLLRLRTADASAREQARAEALVALQTAYGPAHPYRRALEVDQP
ncbi:MAG TPA: tetratricopeptide repeat protein, partial [Enhygromyxa sp.]|nr:tetratricopeptide repeat protein [Enhygromyxa sp.]